jgi:glycosyltransferase involved in cell wall biosynthesis
MDRLVAARQPDEEIIVCDGGSRDGTPEYLQELCDEGKIQSFVSERDKGQSHGLNKGFLMARGEILKSISDDDAYWYPTIRQAANYMIDNPDIDVMLGFTAFGQLNDLTFARVGEKKIEEYKNWLETKEPFWMIDMPMLVRRKSLAVTGLFHTGVVMVDAEFIYRITRLNINIAWCTGVLSMHMNNPNGNFNNMTPRSIADEARRVQIFYDVWESPFTVQGAVTLTKEWIESIKRQFRPAKRRLFERFGLPQVQDPERYSTRYVPREGEDQLTATYRVCDEFMAARNAERKITFLYRPSPLTKVLQAT